MRQGRFIWIALFWFSLVAHGAMVAGCAFNEGEPWGQAEIQLSLLFSPSADRLTADGALRTTTDYAVQIDALRLTTESVTLTVAAEGTESSFDPADPPEGYSLCHNGHCHAEDGSLVDYEEIEAELATGEGGTAIVQPISLTSVGLVETPTAAPLEVCPDRCQLPRGEAVSAAVQLHELEMEVRVFDIREPPRIPAEGISLSGIVPLEMPVQAVLAEEIGEGEEVRLVLDMTLPVTERLFDGIDFSEYSSNQVLVLESSLGLQEAIRNNLLEHTELQVEVERY